MSGITWLASYPKSGNTWFRIFLTNLLQNSDRPADINNLHVQSIKDTLRQMNDALKLDERNIPEDEFQRLRSEIYQQWADDAQDPLFIKMHDANILHPTGAPLIPPDATNKVIYLARNPLDVAPSFANHNKTPVDQTIFNMANPDFSITVHDQLTGQLLRQPLLTWSDHVESWLDDPELDVLLLRFEDLKADPETFFKRAVQFLGLPFSDDEVEKAVAFSHFDRVKEQEQERGFRERLTQCDSFFNQGQAGSWENKLTVDQARQIVDQHGCVMKRLGYNVPELPDSD
ncbi:sulfotransferase domain-containing protein [candidate division KSB1 bacterium]|nr:sulfotransferase domain-containing protein [candidate division KSB1 bacterium]